MKAFTVTASDGYRLAAYRFDPDGAPKASVVIAAAMAVPQSFYAAFATWLAGQGYAVWTFDFRGIGESLHGPRRGAQGDLTDWLGKDYEAVLRTASESHPQLPLFAIGHSFGGQCVPLVPSRELLSGVVNIAVGSGAMRHNTAPIRRVAPFLWYLLVPVLCPLFGYFPGARLGLIGDVPSGAMRQWRRWCLSPDYLLGGEPGARQAYASARYPVLALAIADDEKLLESGSRMVHEAYAEGLVDFRLIEPGQFGLQRIGHSGFFRTHAKDALWPLVDRWMNQLSSGRANSA